MYMYMHLCSGAVGATFAVTACVSAGLRNKDDYKNAVIGGMLAGSIFGYKSESDPRIHDCIIHVSMV